MVCWHGVIHPLPAFIHTFIDFRNLPPRGVTSIDGEKYKPGIYAVVHSYRAVEADAIETPNTMIGKYTIYREKISRLPKLYIIPITSISAPTIGIQDIGGSNKDGAQQHLFLIRRMVEWPASWDSIIRSVYQDSQRRAPSPEREYDESGPLSGDESGDESGDDSVIAPPVARTAAAGSDMELEEPSTNSNRARHIRGKPPRKQQRKK